VKKERDHRLRAESCFQTRRQDRADRAGGDRDINQGKRTEKNPATAMRRGFVRDEIRGFKNITRTGAAGRLLFALAQDFLGKQTDVDYADNATLPSITGKRKICRARKSQASSRGMQWREWL